MALDKVVQLRYSFKILELDISRARTIRMELERVLASSVFVNSPRMRRFLAFVVEETLNGRASEIKEYAIAIEVFEKRSDYDPRTDSTVRSEAMKLRDRLGRYYSTEGAADTLVISLPKGTYVPAFVELQVPQIATSEGSFPLKPLSGTQLAPSTANTPLRHFGSWKTNFPLITGALILFAIISSFGLTSWFQQQRKVMQLEAKGNALTETWTFKDISRGIDYYRQMVLLDPKSASAYSNMATGYLLLSDLYIAPRETMPKAAMAAVRAIELNSQLSNPHVTLGMVKLQFDWDWPGAEEELKKGIALSPNDPMPHQLYGWYLMAEGRFTEATGEMKYAIALDPSSDFCFWELGFCYYFARQFDDAAEQDRRAIALEPKSYWPHMLLGWTLEQQNKFDDAISEMTIATQLTDTPQAIAALAHAQAIAGRHKEADRLLQELIELSKRQYVSPYDVATVYAANADVEQTLTFLERACVDRSGWLPLCLKIDPKFDGVRKHTRFSALLKRVSDIRP